MKVLELFSGSGILSKTFKERGHKTFKVDNNKKLKPDLCVDILELNPLYLDWYDVIWASPPCTTFSVASISTHWTGGKEAYIPKTDECKKGIDRVKKTLEIIRYLKPKYWFIENPIGVLRKMDFMPDHKVTVTYCQYGDSRMKPTDIWNNAYHWIPRPMCSNGDSCHEKAPRGSKTGTQGLKDNYERSKLPVDLCNEIVDVCENKQKIKQYILP